MFLLDAATNSDASHVLHQPLNDTLAGGLPAECE